MANEIVPFGKTKNVPATIAKFFEDHDNIGDKNTINQLSYRGKVWRIVLDGAEKPLMKDDEPVSTVHVVVIDHNKARSRAYYEGAYVAGKATPPACASSDGEVPDANIKNPKAKFCQDCEFSKKGSKITPNGKETTACSVFKRLAIVPLADLTSEPLLLRLAQTSVWDKNNEENEAKGFYAWDQYVDMLRTNGAKHTGAVATKIRFDPRVEYPKLLFAASRWLVDDELADVAPLLKDPRIAKLLAAPEVQVAARQETKPEAQDEEEAPAPAKAKPKVDDDYDDIPAPTKAKAKPKADDDDDAPPPPKAKKAKPADDDEEEAPPPKAKGKAKPADDDEEEAPPPPKAKGKAKPAEEATSKEKGKSDKNLSDLVGEWD